MNRILAVILAAAVLLCLAACGKTASDKGDGLDENETPPMLAGGWSRAETPAVTEEVRALLEKAQAGATGESYIPVAYLGSQVVAGLNHAILCRVTMAAPDAKETYAVVTVYEDLKGEAEITRVRDFGKETNIREGLMGGWTQAESPLVTEALRAIFEKALEGLAGTAYEPLALVSSQVVAGMNYCFLCEAQLVYPGAQSNYALVYIYADLNGGAEISEIVMLPDGE